MDAMDEQPATWDVGERMASALTTARLQIRASRRHITLEDAEAIVRSELDRHGAPSSRRLVTQTARHFYRGLVWRAFHPFQARH
jgi:hypothetical protein